jgi:hypothetical protein
VCFCDPLEEPTAMVPSTLIKTGKLYQPAAPGPRGDQRRLRAGVTHAGLVQLLADGARGVNQSLPPLPAVDLRERYRTMFAAILFGTTEP